MSPNFKTKEEAENWMPETIEGLKGEVNHLRGVNDRFCHYNKKLKKYLKECKIKLKECQGDEVPLTPEQKERLIIPRLRDRVESEIKWEEDLFLSESSHDKVQSAMLRASAFRKVLRMIDSILEEWKNENLH